MIDLTGKGGLIVGAKRMGQTVAMRLAQEGVNLAIAYRNSRAEAEHLQAQIAALVDCTVVLQGDIADENSVKALLTSAHDALGDLSFVINLASGFPRTPLASLDAESWETSLADAKGSYLLCVYGARHMMQNPGPTRGHLILFSDWAARQTPYKDYLPYLTSKAAIDFMTRAFAVELASHGILVNAIAPGPTQRPAEITPASWQQDVLDHAPLQRESSAADIAEIIVTLLKSETITGETIRVDSGRHLAGPGLTG
jgi:NAD(P)-dependent dehydrogenase (short-subunit alcohol dehydrogenase family)